MDEMDEGKIDELIKEISRDVESELEQAAKAELEQLDREIEENRKKNRNRKIKLVFKIILAVIEVFLLALVIFIGSIVLTSSSKSEMISKFAAHPIGSAMIHLFGGNLYNSSFHEKDFDDDEIVTNKPVVEEPFFTQRYTTYVLFGIEGYTDDFDEYSHSDAIMIASIDNETKEVRIASVYRDTYLNIINRSGDGENIFDKVNSAYFFGGALCAINTLNTNLDLAITDYATVNWAGVATVIDALGGVDVNLTEDEVDQINYHMGATAAGIGVKSDYVTSAGPNHLNGLQATTYCRIRYVTFYDPETGEEINNDFGRAARQQFVLGQLIDKAKNADLSTLLSLAQVLINNSASDGKKIFGTSLTLQEILDMIPVLMDFSLGDTYGFPETKMTPDIDGASVVVAADLSYNVQLLHEFLYPDITDYQISDVVDDISTEIGWISGVGMIKKPEEETGESETEESGFEEP